MKYLPPKITEKKCEISFFLTYDSFVDSMEYMFGGVVDAQSGGTNDPNNGQMDGHEGTGSSGSDNASGGGSDSSVSNDSNDSGSGGSGSGDF